MTNVVTGIVVKDTHPESYLLVSSKSDFGEYLGFYYPPGGHVEEGESEVEALKREVKEELGVNVIKTERITDQIASDVQGQRTVWYFCELDSLDFDIDNEEIRDVGFFTEKEMESMKIWPATKKLFNKYIFHARKNTG